MNHKTFSILFIVFFVLTCSMFSTTASRRLLSGSAGGNKMEMRGHRSKSAPSATEQSPPGRGSLNYKALQQPPVCKEKVYGDCTGARKPSPRRCNFGTKCKNTPP
ncbi:uncharacterized protein LOC132642815 isoform X2 [Lycium barbarum]|uniref:uncharacterized protein LOC132642815 isoform X2 n=1 Tax=Lycium barbarum TaxID=112863 RepID=UPI00293ED4DD|nr:uncharacterized protein LOC132642815 isoform X2 [Lycium barbarum]